MSLRVATFFSFCLALALSGGLPVAWGGQDEVVADGRADFELHCQACHGAGGRGDGPMAALLVVPPSDLTAIAAANDGAFPFWRVYAQIEGKSPVKGHETFQMPIFGERLERDVGRPGFLAPHLRVLLLTHFVESLQAE
jgi:mono/diheme cytochrome c family protein